jgi:hypothetical protein
MAEIRSQEPNKRKRLALWLAFGTVALSLGLWWAIATDTSPGSTTLPASDVSTSAADANATSLTLVTTDTATATSNSIAVTTTAPPTTAAVVQTSATPTVNNPSVTQPKPATPPKATMAPAPATIAPLPPPTIASQQPHGRFVGPSFDAICNEYTAALWAMIANGSGSVGQPIMTIEWFDGYMTTTMPVGLSTRGTGTGTIQLPTTTGFITAANFTIPYLDLDSATGVNGSCSWSSTYID